MDSKSLLLFTESPLRRPRNKFVPAFEAFEAGLFQAARGTPEMGIVLKRDFSPNSYALAGWLLAPLFHPYAMSLHFEVVWC